MSVTDGDTLRLDVDCGFDIWRLNQPYRLLRINAPEIRYASGKEARRRLVEFIAGKALVIRTRKTDVYGRFLAEVQADDVNLSDWMVEHRQARYKDYA